MRELGQRLISFLLHGYTAVALGFAISFTPLPWTAIPAVLLLGYLGLLWRAGPRQNLLYEFFLFPALALLGVPLAGPYLAPLVALPLLLSLARRLRTLAPLEGAPAAGRHLRPSPTLLTLGTLTLAAALLGLAAGNVTLLLACGALVLFLGGLALQAWLVLPAPPVAAAPFTLRAVAGTRLTQPLRLSGRGRGWLFLSSPYAWLKLSQTHLPLTPGAIDFTITLTPPLAGPAMLPLVISATDPWGLLQVRCLLPEGRLRVIPRARYAAWLARQYLTQTKPGMLPPTSSVSFPKPAWGLRTGIEYYGSRPFQPGDSLKNVDWKHSARYSNLVSKEFYELRGRPAVILVNLSVGSAEEADKLAARLVTTALSLARESITAALAAYTARGVRLATGLLDPRELVTQALRCTPEVDGQEERTLLPPDLSTLTACLARLGGTIDDAREAFWAFLALEHRSLVKEATHNPASQALWRAFARVEKQANVVIISARNHDATALLLQEKLLTARGGAVLSVR